MAQAIKTHEELGELLSALHRNDRAEIIDAYGDLMVTLIIGADLAGVDLVEALNIAYAQIKDRRGTLREDGVFVKEEA
jgi:NTP pyrophosphatase (non-canonical NTP hydrolase)